MSSFLRDLNRAPPVWRTLIGTHPPNGHIGVLLFYTEFCNTPVLPVCGHGYCYWISGISVRGSTMWEKVGNCGRSARCSTTLNNHQRISSFLFHLQEVLGILRILQQMSTNPQSTVWKRNLRVGGIPVGNNLLYNHQWTAGCFLLSSCRPPFPSLEWWILFPSPGI